MLKMADKDNLKENFNSLKHLMINEFGSMKYCFFKQVNSFKRQPLEISEIYPTRTRTIYHKLITLIYQVF